MRARSASASGRIRWTATAVRSRWRTGRRSRSGWAGFGTHASRGAISDGANSATVTNASGNQVTFSGDFSVQTLTNTGNLDLNGANTEPGGGEPDGRQPRRHRQLLDLAGVQLVGGHARRQRHHDDPGRPAVDFTRRARQGSDRRESCATRRRPSSPRPTAPSPWRPPARSDNAGTLTFADDRDIGGVGEVRNLAGGTVQKTGGAGVGPQIPPDAERRDGQRGPGDPQTRPGLHTDGRAYDVPAGRVRAWRPRDDPGGTLRATGEVVGGGVEHWRHRQPGTSPER